MTRSMRESYRAGSRLYLGVEGRTRIDRRVIVWVALGLVAGCSASTPSNEAPSTLGAPAAVAAPAAPGMAPRPQGPASASTARDGANGNTANTAGQGPAATPMAMPGTAASAAAGSGADMSQTSMPGMAMPMPGAAKDYTDQYVAWDPVCPEGFTPQAGMNTGFKSDDIERQFSVFLPTNVDSARPVFVSLTGTEQSESGFMSQSGVNNLPAMGFIVVAPVRTCTTTRTNCNGWGDNLTNDGRLWEPWFDGSSRDEFREDGGPDVRFFEAMVKCVAMKWKVDPKQIYLGGISAGGTITNRNMTFNSDFFAGGVNSSGAWYSVVGSIRPQPANQVEDEREGWCCPRPFHTMDSSIVINVWGGTRDTWSNASAMPAVNVDFGPETKHAATYYASQEKVLTISCSGTHGHQWPSAGTTWFATTLLSFPKGSDPASFKLTTPPSGLTCVIGNYTDH